MRAEKSMFCNADAFLFFFFLHTIFECNYWKGFGFKAPFLQHVFQVFPCELQS